MGSLVVVLLLAKRARSEGARSTRALEDQPGYPMKRDMLEVRRRGLGMYSLNARSEGQPGHSLPREDLILPCSRERAFSSLTMSRATA